MLDQAAVLGSHGYGVLMLDARGHGGQRSGHGLRLFGERDVAPALDFIARQPEVAASRVGVVGLSMGGEVLITAGRVDDERLAATMLDRRLLTPWRSGPCRAQSTNGLRTRPTEWKQRVLGFLDHALAVTPRQQ